MERETSPARERVLSTAEQLFSERGYTAVTLRDIANTLGMKQASLYNHAPGGKEELYIAVTERTLERHRMGVEGALQRAEPDLRSQLRAAAKWLLSQPPMNLGRMMRSDMPAIRPEQAVRLIEVAYSAMMVPIEKVIEAAYQRGETRLFNASLFAGLFITAIQSLHDVPSYDTPPLEVLAADTVDLLLDGVYRR